MFKTVIFLCAVFALASSQTTAVSGCVFQSGVSPINVYIEGCLTPPCQLPQLQDVVMHMVFRAPHTIRSMRTLATAYVIPGLNIGVDYGLGSEEVTCNFLTNTYCPLLQNEVVQYTLRMYIESFFPAGTSVTIEFRIEDENNFSIMCLRVPVTIVRPLTRGLDASSNFTASLDNANV